MVEKKECKSPCTLCNKVDCEDRIFADYGGYPICSGNERDCEVEEKCLRTIVCRLAKFAEIKKEKLC